MDLVQFDVAILRPLQDLDLVECFLFVLLLQLLYLQVLCILYFVALAMEFRNFIEQLSDLFVMFRLSLVDIVKQPLLLDLDPQQICGFASHLNFQFFV